MTRLPRTGPMAWVPTTMSYNLSIWKRSTAAREPLRLMDLPPEIRLIIYEYAMTEGSHIRIMWLSMRYSIHPLLRVSRLIREEAMGCVAKSIFNVSCEVSAYNDFERFLRRFDKQFPN